MLGLSDFASKGEQCDACVCKEGPSGRGCRGPVFRDLGLSGGRFSSGLAPFC